MPFLTDHTPYLANALALQTFVVALLLFSLGLFSLVRGGGAPESRVFFVLSLFLSLWFLGFSQMYRAQDIRDAMWWAKVAHVGIVFIPAAANHFSALIVEGYEKARGRILACWILGVVFVSVNSVTDLQYSGLYHYPWGFYPRYGLKSIPFLLYFSGVMLAALRGFVVTFRAGGKGTAQQARARTLLIAFGAGVLAAFDFLPSFGIDLYPFGYVPMFFFSILAARSILRYRFRSITPAFAARQIIDTMNDALMVFDRDGVVRLTNRAACGLFGCREEDLVGKRPDAGTVRSPGFAARLASLIGGGEVKHLPVEFQPGEGGTRTFSVSTSVMKRPDVEPLAIVCVMSDVTESMQAARERERLIAKLREANQRLTDLDRLKSDFVNVVSHELRSPLTSIKAFAELLEMNPDMLQEKRTRIASSINAESDSLTRLISDYLDLARIESGSFKWRADPLALEEVVRHAVAAMQPLLEKKRLELTVAISSPLPVLFGDRDRITQVMTNLLSNAIKFTPAGGTIRVAARPGAEPVAHIAVDVADSGIGIPAEDLHRIFEKYHRSCDEQAGRIEGTGLGLAIARQIVEHHGGRIWAASTPGRGSTLSFILPLGRPDAATVTPVL